MEGIIYKKECFILNGILFKIQNDLGTKFLERHYQRALEARLLENKISYQKEFPINIYYANKLLGKFYADFVVYDKIIIELKTTNYISSENIKQMIRYLEATKLKLGLLVNFRVRPIEIKRVINTRIDYKLGIRDIRGRSHL
ncbi:MAG: GxxExxY protein [Patescibacteria group bacterium]|nr:GxxExxY protein [Patescibacteria group bacterium]